MKEGSSRCGSVAMNLTSIYEDLGSIPGSPLQVKDALSCGAGRRHGSDLAWLWLWHRPAATAPIPTPSWKLPHAVGVALKKQKKKKKKKERKERGSTKSIEGIL